MKRSLSFKERTGGNGVRPSAEKPKKQAPAARPPAESQAKRDDDRRMPTEAEVNALVRGHRPGHETPPGLSDAAWARAMKTTPLGGRALASFSRRP